MLMQSLSSANMVRSSDLRILFASCEVVSLGAMRWSCVFEHDPLAELLLCLFQLGMARILLGLIRTPFFGLTKTGVIAGRHSASLHSLARQSLHSKNKFKN